MRIRSFIYEEIIEFLIKQELINQTFYANQIDIPRGKTTTSFIYKHSNPKNKDVWTMFFNRLPNSRPMKFTVDKDCLKLYQKRFELNNKS